MNIKDYIDSTYLKTPEEAGISVEEDLIIVKNYIQEAINEGFKLIMIRPNHIALAKKMIANAGSNLLVGTVIGFPTGFGKKFKETQFAIDNKVDEIDVVIKYEYFKLGNIDSIKNEIYNISNISVANEKTIKWIIEIAALSDEEIIAICQLIRDEIINTFDEKFWKYFYIKSSTGYYKTEHNKPNGATVEGIKLMIENGFPLKIKAAGGIKNTDDALQMIQLGVQRIGTSNAKNIIENKTISGY